MTRASSGPGAYRKKRLTHKGRRRRDPKYAAKVRRLDRRDSEDVFGGRILLDKFGAE